MTAMSAAERAALLKLVARNARAAAADVESLALPIPDALLPALDVQAILGAKADTR